MSNEYTIKLGASGISFGSAMAMVISWSLYHSLWWCFWHGVFGWFYVIYYYFTR